ncbi:hypothetical protein PC120_g10505 [Phytophthora cactorum]|nr:hypothetical protein PC120_g10505 [Phytophthora cactorum]
MVVEGVATASTNTPYTLLLCPLPGAVRKLKNAIALLPRFPFFLAFLFTLAFAPNTIALSYSFPFFLRLTCPALFLIGAIADTLTLLSTTGTLPLGFYPSSAVSLGGCQVGTSSVNSLSVSYPSTFLLRSGHGCAPPSSLFSLALATLPLTFLRASNSLLPHTVSRGAM